MLGRVRRHSFPCVIAPIGPLRLPRRIPAQTLVSLVFGLRCPHRAHGSPRFLGHPLRTRRTPRPRRVRRPRTPSGDGRRCSLPAISRVGHSVLKVSGLTSYGSLVCAPTHRRARCRPASALSPSYPSQGSLPICLAGLIGRVSHPLDDASVFLEGRRTFLSLRTSLSWSHEILFRGGGDSEPMGWHPRQVADSGTQATRHPGHAALASPAQQTIAVIATLVCVHIEARTGHRRTAR